MTIINRRILLLFAAIAMTASAEGDENVHKHLKGLAFDKKMEEARALADS